jgi:hypothetical protein
MMIASRHRPYAAQGRSCRFATVILAVCGRVMAASDKRRKSCNGAARVGVLVVAGDDRRGERERPAGTGIPTLPTGDRAA